MARRDGNTRVYFINNQTGPRRSAVLQRRRRRRRGGGGGGSDPVFWTSRRIFSANPADKLQRRRRRRQRLLPVSSGGGRGEGVRPRPPPPKSLIGLSLPARPRTCAGHKDAGPYRRGVRPSPRRPPARLLLLLRAAAIRELSPSLTVQFRSITIVVTSIALHAARLSTRSPLIGSGIELLGFDSARRIPEARTRVRRPAVSLFLSLSLSLSLSR